MSGLDALPAAAAWAHREARDGFEVAFFTTTDDAILIRGGTCAVEAGQPWSVHYRLMLDPQWRTRRAEVTNETAGGAHRVVLDHDGVGGWLVDGHPAPRLAGCLDIDLEASALTNAFPLRRSPLGPGEWADAPAAYVRALDLGVDRLDQTYEASGDRRYRYAAPAFEVTCELVYDTAGLVLTYPGLAVRAR